MHLGHARTGSFLGVIVVTAAAVLTSTAGPARAADDQTQPAADPDWARSVRNEMIGLELSPMAASFSDGSVEVLPGFGIMARIARRRWMNTYWTPVTTGLFAGKADYGWGGVVQVLTEAGLSWRTPLVTVEAGWGLGVGVVATPVGDACDGTCSVGGYGLLASPVVRAIVRDLSAVSLGLSLRAELPLVPPSHDREGLWGYYVGYGSVLLASVDVGFGS